MIRNHIIRKKYICSRFIFKSDTITKQKQQRRKLNQLITNDFRP